MTTTFVYSDSTNTTSDDTVINYNTYKHSYNHLFSLFSVELSSTVTKLQYLLDISYNPPYPVGCFENSNLSSIIIPDNVITIENSCFLNSVNLTDVTIRNYDGLKYAGTEVLTGCYSLTSLSYYNCSGANPDNSTQTPDPLSTAAAAINGSTSCTIYYYPPDSYETVTDVKYSYGSLIGTFLNVGEKELNSFVAIPGDVILTNDSLIPSIINETIIATFHELKMSKYSESVFPSIQANLSKYLADENLKQSIYKEVLDLTPYVINGSLTNDEFKSEFNPYVKELADEYPEKLFKYANWVEESMKQNKYLLK